MLGCFFGCEAGGITAAAVDVEIHKAGANISAPCVDALGIGRDSDLLAAACLQDPSVFNNDESIPNNAVFQNDLGIADDCNL